LRSYARSFAANVRAGIGYVYDRCGGSGAVMKFQEHVDNRPLNDTTATIGCLHGLSTFTKLYTLTILDDCFSLTDLRIVLLEAAHAAIHFVSFDQFQIKIFNFLVLFECLLLVLLIFVWAKYNVDIYDRFLSTGWSIALSTNSQPPTVDGTRKRINEPVGFSFYFQTQ